MSKLVATTATAPQDTSSPMEDGHVDVYGYVPALQGWLFCGWVANRWEDGTAAIIARFASGRIAAETLTCWYGRPDLGRHGSGLVVLIRASRPSLGALIGLEVRTDARSLRLPPLHPKAHLRAEDLVQRARHLLRAGEGPQRERMRGLLSRRSYAGQDTLGELPVPVRIEVDETILAPPDGLLLIGWSLDPTESVAAVRIRGGRSAASQLLTAERSLCMQRPDVLEAVGAGLCTEDPRCGFIAYAPRCAAQLGQNYLEVELKGGEIGFKPLPVPSRTGIAAIRRVLAEVRLAPDEVEPAFDHVLGPSLQAINTARLRRPRLPSVVEFGRSSGSPHCSVVVPLHGRMDLLTYQLALLSDDERMAAQDLIYVLDDPPRRRELLDLAHSAHLRFGLPFRVVTLEENLGYAPACNIGTSYARAEFTCFLNSDVMPTEPGWLESMIAHLRRDPMIGVLGARLLFEDGTVQHDGMVLKPLPQAAGWPFPQHPGKARLPGPETGLLDVEVVTGACMLMRTELLRDVGGFDESYVIGDFEDSDLCLRIRERGLRCAVDRAVRLWHLERQSQLAPDDGWRTAVTLLNAWTHARRWFRPTAPPGAEDNPA